MNLTLVILAAGKGTRFGGDKPLAAVGPNGESLFEYSVRDAVSAGFERVVFVVSPHQDTSVYSKRLISYKHRLKISFAVQSIHTSIESRLGAGCQRTKPWGTGHALLACRQYIETPFVVINADDYYGASNFELVGEFLKRNVSTPDLAVLPGYSLENTLSNTGGVNRGVCSVTGDGYLEAIREYTNISIRSGVVKSDNPPDGFNQISLDSQVSMTFWGFYPEFFAALELAFSHFLKSAQELNVDEFYIPAAVDFSIRADLLRVKVFPSAEHWLGITYAEDVVKVREYLLNRPAGS